MFLSCEFASYSQTARCPVVSQPNLATPALGTREVEKMIDNNCCKRENDSDMSEENNNRTKWLHLRLKPEEYALLHRHFTKTTSES